MRKLFLILLVFESLMSYPRKLIKLEGNKILFLIFDNHNDKSANYTNSQKYLLNVLLNLDKQKHNYDLLWEFRGYDGKKIHRNFILNGGSYIKDRLDHIRFIDTDTWRSDIVIDASKQSQRDRLQSQNFIHKRIYNYLYNDLKQVELWVNSIIDSNSKVLEKINGLKQINYKAYLALMDEYLVFIRDTKYAYSKIEEYIKHKKVSLITDIDIDLLDNLINVQKAPWSETSLNIMDFEILLNIFYSDRNIILYAGGTHCKNVKTFLCKLGFEQIFETKCDYEVPRSSWAYLFQ